MTCVVGSLGRVGLLGMENFVDEVFMLKHIVQHNVT
jgi:hypothetical protein